VKTKKGIWLFAFPSTWDASNLWCESKCTYIAPRKIENQNQKKISSTKTHTQTQISMCESKYIIAPKKTESQNQKKNSLTNTQTQIKDEKKEKERT